MFELILGECQWNSNPDPEFKILICWIQIRPKMDPDPQP